MNTSRSIGILAGFVTFKMSLVEPLLPFSIQLRKKHIGEIIRIGSKIHGCHRVALCGFEMKIPHSKKKTPAGVTTNFMPTSSNSVTLYNVFFA
jgi:hypothetical protein